MTAIIEELDPERRVVELPAEPRRNRRSAPRVSDRTGPPSAPQATGWCWSWPSCSASSSPCRSCSSSSTRSSRRSTTTRQVPLSLPTEFYFDGIVAFWERVDFPQKLWNSVFISGLVAVFAVVLSMFNAFALGIGRVRGRLWIVVLILLANMLPQEVLLYPLYFMFRRWGLRQPVGGDHHLHRDPVPAFRHLPARIRLQHVCPEGDARGRLARRRDPLADPVARGVPDLATHAVGAAHLLLHLDVERVPDPAHILFLVSNDTQTVPVAITVLQGDRLMDVTTTSASALLGLIPTLVFFLIFQRTLTRGITAGAVK